MATAEPVIIRKCPANNLFFSLFIFRPLPDRTRTVGHPGGPPPAPSGRRRRKNHKGHQRTRYAAEEHTSQTYTSSKKPYDTVSARMSRKRDERCPAGMAGGCRDKSHTGQGGCGSDDCCRSTVQEVLVSKRGRPSCPVHPASAACVHVSSTSPGSNYHHLPQQGPEVTGGAGRGWREDGSTDRTANRAVRYVKYKYSGADTRRRRKEDSCSIVSKDIISAQPQTVAREDLSNQTSGVFSGDRRRASLLKVKKLPASH